MEVLFSNFENEYVYAPGMDQKKKNSFNKSSL